MFNIEFSREGTNEIERISVIGCGASLVPTEVLLYLDSYYKFRRNCLSSMRLLHVHVPRTPSSKSLNGFLKTGQYQILTYTEAD